MTFKKGDKVRISKNLDLDIEGSPGWNEDMDKTKGEIVTLSKSWSDGTWYVEENSHFWHEGWFELIRSLLQKR